MIPICTVDFTSYLIRIFPIALSQTVGNFRSYAQKSKIDAERLESTQGLDLMCLAAAYGRTYIVDILLKGLKQDGIKPEELFDLKCSLHKACKLNNKTLTEMLLKEGAVPWAKDEDGFSAMHHSALNGSLEVS